jgi:hypothetical protein
MWATLWEGNQHRQQGQQRPDTKPETGIDTIRMEMGLIKHQQVVLLYELIGNPFRPVAIAPSCLTWNDGTIRKMAQAIDDERAFDRLPILADALEDVGYTNTDLLTHCRQPGPHVRGCWVVDLILGKE